MILFGWSKVTCHGGGPRFYVILAGASVYFTQYYCLSILFAGYFFFLFFFLIVLILGICSTEFLSNKVYLKVNNLFKIAESQNFEVSI